MSMQDSLKKPQDPIDKLTEVLNDICVDFDEAIEIQKKKLNGNRNGNNNGRKDWRVNYCSSMFSA